MQEMTMEEMEMVAGGAVGPLPGQGAGQLMAYYWNKGIPPGGSGASGA